MRGRSSLLDEGLALLRPLGQREVIAYALGVLGLVALRRGEIARALANLAESLTLCREIGARHWTAQTLETLAAVVVADGRAALAAQLLGAAAALREATGRRVPPAEQDRVEATAAAARGALGGAGFATAETAGRTRPEATLVEAIASARERARGGQHRAGCTRRPAPGPRERDSLPASAKSWRCSSPARVTRRSARR